MDVVLRTILVVAVAGMVNYLASRFVNRFHWSAQGQTALSSRTRAVLHSMTNHVDVTLYYDRSDEYYPEILSLLEEYCAADKNISLRTVDYVRDAGAAGQVVGKYQQHFPTETDTNLIIFDSGNRVMVLPGDKLTKYDMKLVGWEPNPKSSQLRSPEFERRPVAFNGEEAFTSILLALSNPQPLKAYFMQGHGEVSLTDSGQFGFLKFLSVLEQNYIDVANLNWIGSTGVPMDCNLLIIAAPDHPYEESQLQQIAQYLHEGGRLLVMFGKNSLDKPTGLEDILRSWGVEVEDDIAQDFNRSTVSDGRDIIVDQFNLKHPVMAPLSQLHLQLLWPRPIMPLPQGQSANAPQVDKLFSTTQEGTLLINHNEPPHQYPLACAVEQKPVAGVINPRGNTRIIVVGDAMFLGNYIIDSGGNRDFLNSAINWLCDRPTLLSGIGPRPVYNIRLQITEHEALQLNWLLLAILPGSVLLLGWMVWLVRRK